MITRGLIIRSPHIEKILAKKKTWELRGSATRIRGPIGLIKGGSGTVVGTCRIVDVKGPLSRSELKRNARRIGVPKDDFDGELWYRNTYAWVFTNTRRFRRPKRYKHPSGAVIWVRLNPRRGLDNK